MKPIPVAEDHENIVEPALSEHVDAAVAGTKHQKVSFTLSANLERAKRSAVADERAQERLARLQEEGFITLLGINRGKLFSQIWQRHMVKVADTLGVSSFRLCDIFDLYEIPTPRRVIGSKSCSVGAFQC